jgi:cytoskeleton protein RodZ
MDSGVGTILRQARNRRKVELSEVEAATRIRFRFLRAIEDEEWDVLPGGVYTRGFIRTYASFLGLDGDRLVGEYRESVEPWHRSADAPQSQPDGASGANGPRSVALAALVVVAVIAVAVIAIVAIPSGGGGDGGSSPVVHRRGAAHKATPEAKSTTPHIEKGVTVELTASAEVWACVLDANGKALVDGLILEAGAEEGPFHSGSFTVSFGNGEVKMRIDGREAEIPATSSPIGYAIGPKGKLTKLEEAERPTCA